MQSLYLMIYNILASIMNYNGVTSSAAELVAICATLLITYFIIFAPLRFVIELLCKKVKL